MLRAQAFSYAGEFEQALGVRGRMAEEGFEPTPPIWGSLLVACGAAGHLETAAVLWAELKERHKQLLAEAEAGAAGAAGEGERVEGAAGAQQQEEQQERRRRGLLTAEVFNAMMTACIDGYQARALFYLLLWHVGLAGRGASRAGRGGMEENGGIGGLAGSPQHVPRAQNAPSVSSEAQAIRQAGGWVVVARH